MEQYAGVDLHKKVTQLAVLREGKTPSHYRFSNDPRKVEGALMPNYQKSKIVSSNHSIRPRQHSAETSVQVVHAYLTGHELSRDNF